MFMRKIFMVEEGILIFSVSPLIFCLAKPFLNKRIKLSDVNHVTGNSYALLVLIQ